MKSFNQFLNYLVAAAIAVNALLCFLYFREQMKPPVLQLTQSSLKKNILQIKKEKTNDQTAVSSKVILRVLIDNSPKPQLAESLPGPAADSALAPERNVPKDKLSAINAELVPWLLEASKGDEAVLKQMIEDAKNDPQAFVKRLPASMQEKVLEISNK